MNGFLNVIVNGSFSFRPSHFQHHHNESNYCLMLQKQRSGGSFHVFLQNLPLELSTLTSDRRYRSWTGLLFVAISLWTQRYPQKATYRCLAAQTACWDEKSEDTLSSGLVHDDNSRATLFELWVLFAGRFSSFRLCWLLLTPHKCISSCQLPATRHSSGPLVLIQSPVQTEG